MGACRFCGATISADTHSCPDCGSTTKLGAADARAEVAVMPQSGALGLRTLSTNVVGALAYLGGMATGMLFLVLDPYKSNSFIRFHAFQSIFFNVSWVALWILSIVLSDLLTAGVIGSMGLPLTLVFAAAGIGISVLLMYQAYQQELFKLPVLGKFAADHAGVRL